MASTPREIGTLIVVILKARNLPNKRNIGKQDPYCAIEFNKDKRRTKAVRRGGQHPEWDEEIRFTLFEDLDLSQNVDADGPAPPPPPKKSAERVIKGGKSMWLACYADDPREPDLIGETHVDLTEVLSKGETDEWFTLLNKEKYCGEIYLELTFWSNDKPPEKRVTPQASAINPNYGGPGSFSPISHQNQQTGSDFDGLPPVSHRVFSNLGEMILPSRSTLPPSLRPSTSLAQLDLYTPPYERHNRFDGGSQHEVRQLTNSLAELGVGGVSRRRESLGYTAEDNLFSNSTIPSINTLPIRLPQTHNFDDYRSSSVVNNAPSMLSFPSYDSYPSRSTSNPIQHHIVPEEHRDSARENIYDAPSTQPSRSNISHFDEFASLPSVGLASNSMNGRTFSPSAISASSTSSPYSLVSPHTSFPVVYSATQSNSGTYSSYSGYPLAPSVSAPTQAYTQPLPPSGAGAAPPHPSPTWVPSQTPSTNNYSAAQTTSPYRTSTPNHQHQTPPGGSRPLPDPYNQSPLSKHPQLSGPLPSVISLPGNPGPGSIINTAHAPPHPGSPHSVLPAQDRFQTSFHPPPPPPPISNNSFSPQASISLPQTSFDFSRVPPPPPLLPPRLGTVSNMFQHDSAPQSSNVRPYYTSPPPPPPPHIYNNNAF